MGLYLIKFLAWHSGSIPFLYPALPSVSSISPDWPSRLLVACLWTYVLIAYIPASVNGGLTQFRDFPIPLHLALYIMSLDLCCVAISNPIVCFSWRLLLTSPTILVKVSTITLVHSLDGASPCSSFQSAFLQLFHALLFISLFLLRAAPVRLVSEILVCCSHSVGRLWDVGEEGR